MKESPIIINRLRKNLKNRKSLVKQSELTAYRLYEKDIPEFPYIIDIYENHAVIYEKGKRLNKDETSLQQEHQNQIIHAVSEVLSFPKENIILKEREIQKGVKQYKKISREKVYFPVSENKMKFLVNLHDYLDTGLFLDHRPLRKIILDSSQNKKVLNLFAYTGSISVAAALGGGATTTVDMSNTYLDWAKKNFELNKISMEKHKFQKLDVTKLLKAPLKEKYDIIILDPPSFSNSKSMHDVFEVQKDHVYMIRGLMKSLNPKGVLYFSNNFRKFKMSEELINDYNIEDISLKTIPKDFRDLKIHHCFKMTLK